MTEAVYNNQKSLDTLNQLVSNGFYKGVIEENSFILTYDIPTNELMQYEIQGNLNVDDNRFYLKAKLTDSARIFYIFFAIILVIIISAIAVYKSWLVLFVIPVSTVLFIIYTSKLRRQYLNLFIEKYSQFYYT